NVDQIAVIAAPLPAPDWFVVDRYLAAARFARVSALLVFNKEDLGWTSQRADLAAYEAVVGQCIEVSALRGSGIPEVRSAISGSATLLVGQSGVGKSTLINSLVKDSAAQTAALTRESEGRHTTSTARRYLLGESGAIIDAPGVRDFAPPAPDGPRPAQRAFAEI